ncbi:MULTISPECIES: class I SAM-dependent methyltransferase [Frankia]|uniref:class I SAM-dependent DNA methyltransferase n=1 Tax=Frankia TaxID=1854 RepID=UPI001F5B4252|nr:MULTISPECIES: class I SAM-dependent methyltransferase [Frankia]
MWWRANLTAIAPLGSTDLDPAAYGEHIADVYDEWYSAPDRQPEVAVAVDFLRTRVGAGPALELGVGTGRLALPFAARGTAVVGIDASPRMVARLRGKPGGSEIEVVVGDFAEVDAPGGPFGLVYVVFNTFFALADQDAQVRCFANVAAALRPGGVFVMEAFVPDVVRYDRGQRVQADRLDGETTHLNVSLHDPVSQRVRSHHIVLGSGGVGTYPVDIRYAWPSELDLMGRLAGLELAERWAGWNGEPFTATSTSHISVWRRPQ